MAVVIFLYVNLSLPVELRYRRLFTIFSSKKKILPIRDIIAKEAYNSDAFYVSVPKPDIKFIEAFKWWDKPVYEIQSLIPLLSDSDLELVKRELKNRTQGTF